MSSLTMSDLLRAKQLMDLQDAPLMGRVTYITPYRLYRICEELLRLGYDTPKSLEDCMAAIAAANWGVVELTKPATIYGMEIRVIYPE